MSPTVDVPEPHRPALHFSPRRGWMNDPNGLVRVDGRYHAFYQHDPHGPSQGPMHWGHAVSDDLTSWTELPVALYPDALGTCFSGSAVVLPDGAVKLFYTAHRERADGSAEQTQCLVHADAALTRFERDARHPVLANPGLPDFRDPKVFHHAGTSRWIMLVTHGQCIGIYASPNLVDWSFESTFGESEGHHGTGPWECPDLVPLRAPDGRTAWVLIVGLQAGARGGGSGTQYFVGRFDGHAFVNDNDPDTVLWMDVGRDFYAAQSFAGTGGEAPLVMAWASNWDYAHAKPTREFRGALSLPRRLGLEDTGDGPRLVQRVPDGVAARFDAHPLVEGSIEPTSGTYRVTGSVDLEPGERVVLSPFGGADDTMMLARDAVTGARRLAIRRSSRLRGELSLPAFATDHDAPVPGDGPVRIDCFVDNGIVELCIDDGALWATNIHFPEAVDGPFEVVRERGAASPD